MSVCVLTIWLQRTAELRSFDEISRTAQLYASHIIAATASQRQTVAAILLPTSDVLNKIER